MIIIGIDPGKKGGLAWMEDGVIIDVLAMPVAGKELDLGEIVDFCNSGGDKIIVDFAYIEKVGAMPGQGVVSMFTFGKVTGALYGIMAALKIPYRLVTPQTWKKAILLDTDRSKEAALDYVKRIHPFVELKATAQSRKAHMGIVDAICIAEYGWRKERE